MGSEVVAAIIGAILGGAIGAVGTYQAAIRHGAREEERRRQAVATALIAEFRAVARLASSFARYRKDRPLDPSLDLNISLAMSQRFVEHVNLFSARTVRDVLYTWYMMQQLEAYRTRIAERLPSRPSDYEIERFATHASHVFMFAVVTMAELEKAGGVLPPSRVYRKPDSELARRLTGVTLEDDAKQPSAS